MDGRSQAEQALPAHDGKLSGAWERGWMHGRSYHINAVRTASYNGHVHGDMVPSFRVSVPSGLDFETASDFVVCFEGIDSD